jgi:hypothetical protein
MKIEETKREIGKECEKSSSWYMVLSLWPMQELPDWFPVFGPLDQLQFLRLYFWQPLTSPCRSPSKISHFCLHATFSESAPNTPPQDQFPFAHLVQKHEQNLSKKRLADVKYSRGRWIYRVEKYRGNAIVWWKFHGNHRVINPTLCRRLSYPKPVYA